MNEVKNFGDSVLDFIKANAKKIEEQKRIGTGILAERIVFQKVLSRDSDFAFCPQCKERVQRGNFENWKNEIKETMTFRSIKMLIRSNEKTGIIATEPRWYCRTCKKEFTAFEIVEFYKGEVTPKSKVIDLTKVDVTDPNFIASF